MRLHVWLVAVLLLLGSAMFVNNPAYAASPWNDLWSAVLNLQNQATTMLSTISRLQSQISSKSSISYYQITSERRTIAPGTSGFAKADCNAGDTVMGGGYDINPPPVSGDSLMVLYTNIPFGTGSWAVAGVNPGLNANPQSLYAYAVCSHYN